MVVDSKYRRRNQIPLLSVTWEGTQFVHHSLALVNRELCLALLDSGKCDLRIVPFEPHEFSSDEDPERFSLIQSRIYAPLRRPVQFHIRHQWPPNFQKPAAPFWIIMQPYEYGSMPKEWLPHFRDRIDEIWVYSNHTRSCYIHDGIDAEKIAVIPLAVDTRRFNPEARPCERIHGLTNKTFKFLFVGGTLWRKGIDILLEAFCLAFSRGDDVALIIKDMGTDSFYRGQNSLDRIRKLQTETEAPEIVYINDTLGDRDLPGLYTACDCLVHPYRAEGFGLPIAEAMACGTPVILTRGGAADDFTSDDSVFYIPAEWMRVKLEVETVNNTWVLNPDTRELAGQMNAVVRKPDILKAKGAAAQKAVRCDLSWEKSATVITERLSRLQKKIEKTPERDDRSISKNSAVSARKLNRMGEYLFKQGEPTAAELHFIWAMEADPDLADPYNNIAVLSWHRGKPATAVQMLTRALEREPCHAQAIENICLIKEELDGEK